MHTNTPDAYSLSRRSDVTQSWRKSFELHRIFALTAFNIVCNVAILYAIFHTFKFGVLITNGSWWITDNNLLSVIEFTAKLPTASTVLIGGLAASRLWSSNLEDALSAAGIAEPQSLNVFSSVLAIPRVVSYIVQSRYVFARKPYLLIVLSAILLRFYSTAIVTLLTPALTFVKNPTATYQFTELPFMTQPGYGNRCNLPYISDNEVQSCLQIMLAGSALVDVDGYNGTRAWSEDGLQPLWTKVDIAFPSLAAGAGGDFVVGAIPLGPLNGIDLTNGVLMTGLNLATIERLLGQDNSRFRDSVEFLIQVETSTPLLTCRCGNTPRLSDNVSSITIGVDAYYLSTPVPSLQDGEAVGQVTPDNATLLLSFGTKQRNAATHCAINLTLKQVDITIHGSSPQTGIPSSVVASPSHNPWELGNLTDLSHVANSPMRDFSNYWLGGIGWSTSPNKSAVASLLAGLPIGTGTIAGSGHNASYLEYHLLTMLASGISMGFPPEHPPSPLSSTNSTRSYNVKKREYYIGLRTHFQTFLVFVIIFDCVFVICCLVIITQDGWYLDWTDSATLVRASLLDLCYSVE